jgi:plastocyanin
MQTKFLRREYWLPPLAVLFFLAGSSLVFAQETPKAEMCNADICYIKITGDGFSPSRLVVRDGSTVIWKNVDSSAHMIAGGPAENPALFNSSLLSSGRDYAFVFNGGLDGKFTYLDQSRNNVAGEIVVAPRALEDPVKQVSIDFADPSSGLKIEMAQGNVTAATAIPQLHRMTIWIGDAPGPGMLKVTVDRRLLDSQAMGADTPFEVLVAGNSNSDDDKPANYKEILPATPAQRTLVVPVAEGTKSVTIVGRQMSVDMLGYSEAQAALERAEKAIAEFRGNGVVVSDAEGMLLNAHDAFAGGKYRFAKSLADEATDLASSINRTAQAAKQATNVAEVSIKNTKALGIPVPEAEEMLQRTKEMYLHGGYDDALSMAVQAKMAAADPANQFYMAAGIASVSAGWVVVYMRLRHKGIARAKAANEETGPVSIDVKGGSAPVEMQQQLAPQIATTAITVMDLDRVFAQKPHIRSSDRDVLKYVMEQNHGEALLADIRNRFLLPKSSAWRLVKRLEREELIEIIKFGNQNLIRCRPR